MFDVVNSSSIEIDPAWIPADMLSEFDSKPPLSFKFSRAEKKVLRRRPYIKPSHWVEKNIVLPDDAAVPGKYSLDMVPYAAGIMDASFYPGVQEIVICAPSQTSKTTIVNNCIGYAADRFPGNAVVVFPDEITAKDNAKDRMQQMINKSPLLRRLKTGVADDEGALKIKLRHMIIYMAWANSASRLANRPAPYGVADEEDKFPKTAGKKESGPVDLLRNRARTFSHMRKLWRVSTPTIESGPIWVALTKEAQVVFDYWVRCPDCGHLQLMTFSNIKWDGGSKADPEQVESKKAAWYECEKCASQWSDVKRNMAARMGMWLSRGDKLAVDAALKSHKPRVIGFHLQAWVSPFVSISESAAAFIRGQNDITKFKKFKNDHECVPWVIRQKERKRSVIFDLCDDRPDGMVPGGGVVSCLTAGIDTQDYSFWYEIRAWGWGMSLDSWQVRAGEVLTFEDLEKVLWGSTYVDADGKKYFVRMALQDAMGHRTSEVYDFCRVNGSKIFPTQGKDVMAQPFTWSNIDFYPGKKVPIPGGIRLIRFDTTYFKNDLSNHLSVKLGDPGAWLFNSDLTETWASHMTAEAMDEKGKWVPRTGMENKNHGWDCSVLNRLAAEVLGVKYWSEKKEDPAIKKTKGRRVLSSGVEI